MGSYRRPTYDRLKAKAALLMALMDAFEEKAQQEIEDEKEAARWAEIEAEQDRRIEETYRLRYEDDDFDWHEPWADPDMSETLMDDLYQPEPDWDDWY